MKVGRRIVIRNRSGLMVTGGKQTATILVVCDKPSRESQRHGVPMPPAAHKLFLDAASAHGLEEDDFVFVSPCEPMPMAVEGSAKREGEFLAKYRPDLIRTVAGLPSARMIVSLGSLAARQVYGSPIQITHVRGVVQTDLGQDMRRLPWLPILSPLQVLRFPAQEEVFRVDFAMMARMHERDFKAKRAGLMNAKPSYRWVSGREMVRYMRENKAFSLDTEGTGIPWHAGHQAFLLQVSARPGDGLCCPISHGYKSGDEKCKKNWRVIKRFLENPASDYHLSGHNLKFDLHCLENTGIVIPMHRWAHETLQLVFCMDENIANKELSECVKLVVPEMGGYSDEFDRTVDKSEMLRVPPALMLPYAAGDADATLRLTKRLISTVQRDSRQWACYERVQMPAMRMFYQMEKRGMRVDKAALRAFAIEVQEAEKTLYDELIREVPGSIKRKHIGAGSRKGNGLSFSRADFVLDILFRHPDGFRFTPTVFTSSTANLPEAERVPSVSKKDHLPFFDHEPWVAQLIQYQTIAKLLSTYVGNEGTKDKPAKGLWQYICDDGRIRPSYWLHRTVTGRAASSDPNGQNLPKRGKLAKAYRKIFVPRKGYVFGELDLSQAELRVAACMANDQVMIRLYQQGADIHMATAAAVMGLTIAQFKKLPKEEQEVHRTRAKAVNFGFLYGMWWRKFRSYAKTDYGLTITENEAKAMRDTFFRRYPGLQLWHNETRAFVRANGYVRALHGAIRHLPNIRSYDEAIQSEAERQAINSPVQRFASDLALIGLTRLARDLPPRLGGVCAFVHDAGILEIKAGYETEVLGAAKWYMENPPLEEWFGIELPVPVVADAKVGENLCDMREIVVRPVRPDWATAD